MYRGAGYKDRQVVSLSISNFCSAHAFPVKTGYNRFSPIKGKYTNVRYFYDQIYVVRSTESLKIIAEWVFINLPSRTTREAKEF